MPHTGTGPQRACSRTIKLVEAGMTFKVASTDVAWWHRIGESGKPTRSWAARFSDLAKQTNFWDMAMALANELSNFNIVVECNGWTS
jgi:hypothetical protein